jgi:hypothetical protein
MKEYYRKFREELEAYFRKRRSKKVSKELERFYENNFADEEYEDPLKGVGGPRFMPPLDTVMNDIGEGIKKIPEEAERLNIPVTEVAGFCFHRLLSDAIWENAEANQKFSDLKRDNLEHAAKEFEEIYSEDEVHFKAAHIKMKACEKIAKEFDLGDDAVEIAERDVKRIERKMNLAKTIRQSFEGEKYEGSGNTEDAMNAYEDLREMIHDQAENIFKEKKALLDQEIGRWKSRG